MKTAPFLLLLLFACSQPNKVVPVKKYFMGLHMEIGSRFNQRVETVFKTDSVFAPTAEAAADSLILWIYSWQYVDSLSKANLTEAGAADQIRYGGYKVMAAVLFDHAMKDIDIPSSVVDSLVAKHRVDLANVRIGISGSNK